MLFCMAVHIFSDQKCCSVDFSDLLHKYPSVNSCSTTPAESAASTTPSCQWGWAGHGRKWRRGWFWRFWWRLFRWLCTILSHQVKYCTLSNFLVQFMFYFADVLLVFSIYSAMLYLCAPFSGILLFDPHLCFVYMHGRFYVAETHTHTSVFGLAAFSTLSSEYRMSSFFCSILCCLVTCIQCALHFKNSFTKYMEKCEKCVTMLLFGCYLSLMLHVAFF